MANRENIVPANTDRELLVQLDGKIQRVLDKIEDSGVAQRDLQDRLNSHSNRFMALENRLNMIDNKFSNMDGERKGIATTVKVWWVLASGSGGAALVAAIAAVLRSKGV